ncbi:protein TASOR [Trichomycterus rosablanca]|uniref:protein TASOR n=1 Tax=Trichomycterus rosablanca TaxID=2290929 RepID=UPI002F35904D
MQGYASRSGERQQLQQRSGNTPNQDGDCEEESGAPENRTDYSDAQRYRDTIKPACSYRLAEEPARLNFHIPRRNKEKRALFQHLSSESREFTEILNILTSSYKDPASQGNFVYTKPRLIHNELLEKEFIEKRKELKQDGRPEKELAESFCFLLCDVNKVPLLCEKGLSVNSSWLNTLGNSSKGVYLCQFSDLLQISPHEPGSTGEIIIFKVIKGKAKSTYDNVSKCLDPTPKFDSHFSKNANRATSLQSYKAFEYTQQYFYEYVDFELVSRPRHVCPFAVVSFQFKSKEAATVCPKPLSVQRSNSLSAGTERHNYTVWNGLFVNGGKEVYQACLRSISKPFLPFKLPDRIEIGKVMRLEQVKEVIPLAMLTWGLYSSSSEVFNCGMHCSLFEVVEKSKSAEGLAELFQKLEEKELVLVNAVNDRGFLFLLSSGQMSNQYERRAVWKNSRLLALFVYQHTRDVSKSSRPSTYRMPLTPVPLEPVMPHLNTFIPALHYSLSKIRVIVPSNPSAAVQQQAYEYLTSIRESKPVQPVRLSYDQKLDYKEEVFPGPRQRFNWESYMRPYTYFPRLFTIPVEKATSMVESLCSVPDSGSAPETEDCMKDQSDPERLMELLNLIQMNKNLEETVLIERRLEEVASGAHGLKRKLEEEVQEVNSKCLKRANGQADELKAEELKSCPSLTDVLNSIGLQDTDLRKDRTQDALKVVQLLDELSKTALNTDQAQAVLVSKMQETLNKSLSEASVNNFDSTEALMSGEDPEKTLHESMAQLGLPTNCDTDLRQQFVDDDGGGDGGGQEIRGKNYLEEETTGSLSSLEAFSPCSDSNGHQRGLVVPGERSIPWVLIPITGLKTERYSYRRDASIDDPRFLQSPTVLTRNVAEKIDDAPPDLPDSSNMEADPKPQPETQPEPDSEVECVEDQVISLIEREEPKGSECPELTESGKKDRMLFKCVDSIVDEQISGFSAKVEELLREERVSYEHYSSPTANKNPAQTPMVPFSEYVSHFNTPLPVHSYIDSFRDSVSAFIDPRRNSWGSVSSSAFSNVSAPHQSSSTANPSPTSSTPSIVPRSGSTLMEQQQQQQPEKLGLVNQPAVEVMQRVHDQRQHEQSSVIKDGREGRVPHQTHRDQALNKSTTSLAAEVRPQSTDGRASHESPTVEAAPDAISSVISQLQPDVFDNLVKIMRDMQKNTVHFHIHCVDEKSDVCWEIKEYLTRLGNPECDPQTFVMKKESQDKLLIVIQNIDIASSVHTIPALVSLKKLPSVSFAGVDSLDDIKNHTYNELFVSGGFIVSDEFVLNPDFISLDRLQALLQYLEELNTPESPWRWRVHCKTHKKVKELSRSKSEALDVLNLLTTYHKKQIVEFLSYHECDSPLHQAPDLNCLVKLQAQHIQQRHVIFLTERQFEMFPQYSSSGIVIANIDDILYSMASLIGESCDKAPSSDLQFCPSPSLREDNEGPSSDIHVSRRTSAPEHTTDDGTDQDSDLTTDLDLSLSNSQVGDKPNMVTLPSPTSGVPKELDFDALKAAISHFRVARMQASASNSGQSSPSPFINSAHQVFISESDEKSSVPQCSADEDDLSSTSTPSLLSSKDAVSQIQEDFMLEASSSEAQTQAEAVSSMSHVQDEACPADHSPVEPAASRTNCADPDTTTDILSNTQSIWSDPSKTVQSEMPASSRSSERESHEKNGTNVDTTKNLSSSSTRSIENLVTVRKNNYRGQPGLLPVPRNLTYGVGNPLVSMDGLLLQRSSLWAAAAAQRSVTNSIGMVPQSGVRGLLPSSNINMAWNSLTQGTASNVLGMQQLGQVQRTQYIQGYAWHGNQGNAYPPRRGGYGSW